MQCGPPTLTPVLTGIRLAGATNDVHVFDARVGKWEKITPLGEPPSPRAAHAAAAVGNMVVIQVRVRGGVGWRGRVRTGGDLALYGCSVRCCGAAGGGLCGCAGGGRCMAHACRACAPTANACPPPLCRAALGLPVWPRRTCMSWTSRTLSGPGGTGGEKARGRPALNSDSWRRGGLKKAQTAPGFDNT